jgi:hypothetical protein
VQGSSLSPILFNAFIDELIQRLNTCRKVSISGYHVNNLFFADDGALFHNEASEIRIMLHLVDTWSRETGTTFEPTKCEVLVAVKPAIPFQLSGVDLPYCRIFRYLGIWFDNHGINHEISFDKRIQAMKYMTNLLNHRGYNGHGWTPKCIMAVYRTFLRPMMEYGLGLDMVDRSMLEKLEKAQAWALRTGFSVAGSTSYYALLGVSGLDNMQYRNQRLNARFMATLHNSIDGRVPAVMTYWQRNLAGNNDADSLVYRWRNKNALATKMQLRTAMEGTASRNPNPVVRKKVEDAAAERERRNEEIMQQHRIHVRKMTYLSQSWRIAGWTVDRDDWNNTRGAPLLTSYKFLPSKDDRRLLFLWMVGRIAYHQPCGNCDGATELSRRHAVECSGMEPWLRNRFHTASARYNPERNENLLDICIQQTNYGTMRRVERASRALCLVHIIAYIAEFCARRRDLAEVDEEELARAEEERRLLLEMVDQQLAVLGHGSPAVSTARSRKRNKKRSRKEDEEEEHENEKKDEIKEETNEEVETYRGAVQTETRRWAGDTRKTNKRSTVPRNRRPKPLRKKRETVSTANQIIGRKRGGRPPSAATLARREARIREHQQLHEAAVGGSNSGPRASLPAGSPLAASSATAAVTSAVVAGGIGNINNTNDGGAGTPLATTSVATATRLTSNNEDSPRPRHPATRTVTAPQQQQLTTSTSTSSPRATLASSGDDIDNDIDYSSSNNNTSGGAGTSHATTSLVTATRLTSSNEGGPRTLHPATRTVTAPQHQQQQQFSTLASTSSPRAALASSGDNIDNNIDNSNNDVDSGGAWTSQPTPGTAVPTPSSTTTAHPTNEKRPRKRLKPDHSATTRTSRTSSRTSDQSMTHDIPRQPTSEQQQQHQRLDPHRFQPDPG